MRKRFPVASFVLSYAGLKVPYGWWRHPFPFRTTVNETMGMKPGGLLAFTRESNITPRFLNGGFETDVGHPQSAKRKVGVLARVIQQEPKLGPPVVLYFTLFCIFVWEGSPTKIDYGKSWYPYSDL